MFRGDATPGRPAGLGRFEFCPFRSPPADIKNDRAEGDAHRHFNQTGVPDLPCESEHLGSRALRRSNAGKPGAAPADDRCDVRESLDVVDERWRSPQSSLRRVGGTRTGPAAFPLDGTDERGFLAADEGPRTDAEIDTEVESRFENPVAKKSLLFRMLNRQPQPFDGKRIFGADVDVPLVGPHGIAGDRHSLKHPVRVSFKNAPVHECARIPFVGVAHNILLLICRLADDPPFQSRGIPRTSASAKTALPYLVDDFARSHLGHDLGERGVALRRDVFVDVLGVDAAAVLEDDLELRREKGARRVDKVLAHLLPIEDMPVDDLLRDRLVDVLVHGPFGSDADEGAFPTEPHTARPDSAHFPLNPSFFQDLQKRVTDAAASTRCTAGGGAIEYPMCELPLALLFLLGELFEIFDRHAGTSSFVFCHSSMRATADSGVSFAATLLSTTATGARPHDPTQRAETRDTWSSGVVSPNLMWQRCSTAC